MKQESIYAWPNQVISTCAALLGTCAPRSVRPRIAKDLENLLQKYNRSHKRKTSSSAK